MSAIYRIHAIREAVVAGETKRVIGEQIGGDINGRQAAEKAAASEAASRNIEIHISHVGGADTPNASRSFHAYSDSESEEITASSIDEAAEKFGIPSPDEIAGGAFLLVRDEETYQEKTWGTVPR